MSFIFCLLIASLLEPLGVEEMVTSKDMPHQKEETASWLQPAVTVVECVPESPNLPVAQGSRRSEFLSV